MIANFPVWIRLYFTGKIFPLWRSIGICVFKIQWFFFFCFFKFGEVLMSESKGWSEEELRCQLALGIPWSCRNRDSLSTGSLVITLNCRHSFWSGRHLSTLAPSSQTQVGFDGHSSTSIGHWPLPGTYCPAPRCSGQILCHPERA